MTDINIDGLAYGTNAQNPTGAGMGIINRDVETCKDTISAAAKVFDGRRTSGSQLRHYQ